MKKILFIAILILGYCKFFAQEPSEVRLNQFFIQTLNDYFGNRDSLNNKPGQYYILRDSIPIKVIEYFKDSTLYFVSYADAYPLIKDDVISELYWANYKQFNLDTFDISIGGWSVDFEHVFRFQKVEGKLHLITKNYNFSAWCGGTIGYIPQGRLIFDHDSNDWRYITEKSIIDQKTQLIKDNIDNYR